jgi:hypothetical protein
MQLTDTLYYPSNGIMGLHDTVFTTGTLQAGLYQTTLIIFQVHISKLTTHFEHNKTTF